MRPTSPVGPPDLFICGSDESARRSVAQICVAFEQPTIDLGGTDAPRHVEPWTMVWILVLVRTGNGSHAFKLPRK